jgi:hypothetical protein
VGLKLNETHHLLAYADVNLLEYNIDTTGCGKLASFSHIAIK